MHTTITVLPRFTRLPWQIKNRVNQKSRYTSHSMDKIIFQKCQKNFYKALFKVLIEIFFDMIKKPRNRKPRNGKQRKTRDYCTRFGNTPSFYQQPWVQNDTR